MHMKLPLTQDERYQNTYRKSLRLTHPNRGVAIAMLSIGLVLIILALLGLHAGIPHAEINAALQQRIGS
jgi:hypothetical protein